mgnify:CR=1 FL=1
MTFDSTVTFVHVVLAIVVLGSNLTYGIWLAGGGQPQVLRGIKRLHDRVGVPAFVLLGATGVILLVRGPWDLSTSWVLASLLLYVVALGVAVLVYRPALAAQLERGSAPSARAGFAGGATALLVVVIGFLMITKPG